MNAYWAESGFYIWDPQIGNKVYGTDWIFKLSILPLSFVGGELLTKGLLILIVTMSGFGVFCLGKRLKLSPYAAFAGGVFYVFSPIIFTRIVAGHLYYLIAYFLSPLILWSFLKGKENTNIKYFIISALLLSFAAIQLQFIVMIILILLVFAIADIRKIKRGIAGFLIVVSLSLVIVLSPILIPQLLIKNAELPFIPTQLFSYHGLVKGSDLEESFRILGYRNQPYGYPNLGTPADLFQSNEGIIPSWIFYLDFILPVLGFSVLLFRRDRYTLSLAIIALIGLFLLKGLNPPFPSVFSFLFLKGLYIFREIWHLAFLYGFSLTLLLAFFIDGMIRLNSRRYVKGAASIALVILIVVSNGYPLLLGNFAGYLQTYSFPNEYQKIYGSMFSNPNYNTLVLPFANPIKYDDLRLAGLDPLVINSPSMILPTILSSKGTPTLGFSTWLLSSIQENKTNNLGNLLSGFGFKYVVLRKDFVSNYPNYTTFGTKLDFEEKWNVQKEPFLDSQNDLKLISNNSNYAIYENLNNVKKIFLTNATAGGLTDFDSLLLISNVTSLSDIAVFPNISSSNSIIFIDNKNETNMPINDFVSIGKYSPSLDPTNGWADNKNSFGYSHILAARVKEGIFSDSSNSVVSLELPTTGNDSANEVWMKALSWNQGGNINLQINNELKPISLYSHDNSFSLFKIFEGEYQRPLNLTISNVHGRNYIEGIYIKSQPVTIPAGEHVVSNERLQNERNLIRNSDFTSGNHTVLPTDWHDRSKACDNLYICNIDTADGWDDKKSFQISTSVSNQSWTSIHSNSIDVKPQGHYELGTHMKLNDLAVRSHVTLNGLNQTSNNWYQITQCPGGRNGPMEWSVFVCSVQIPKNTTQVRVEVKAGWSSNPLYQSVSWFDAFYLKELPNMNTKNIAQSKDLSMLERLVNSSTMDMTKSNTLKEFKKENPTRWSLDSEISKPTTIGFAEPYDKSWRASVYREGNLISVVNAVPLYGTINGFNVRDTGNLEVIIEYVPQKWYNIGLAISFATITISIVFLIVGSNGRVISKHLPGLLHRVKFSRYLNRNSL